MKAFNDTSKLLIAANIKHTLKHREKPQGKQQMIYVKAADMPLLLAIKAKGYSLSELFSIALNAAK